MARKGPDPKAKAKKQKIILAAGGVILLGLLAFQLPKLMKGSSPPPTAVVATTTTDATGAASPTPAAGATAAPSSTPVSAELTFSTSVEKVASLSSFHARDPFKPLISSSTAVASPSASTAPPAAVPASPAASAGKGPLFGTVEGSTVVTSNGVPKISKGSSLPTATIMFNGKRLQLKLGQAFPKSKPVFRLAGIQSGNVLVALVKGGLADGSAVIKLPTRHPVTLINTVDKRRYTLVLLTGKKGA